MLDEYGYGLHSWNTYFCVIYYCGLFCFQDMDTCIFVPLQNSLLGKEKTLSERPFQILYKVITGPQFAKAILKYKHFTKYHFRKGLISAISLHFLKYGQTEKISMKEVQRDK